MIRFHSTLRTLVCLAVPTANVWAAGSFELTLRDAETRAMATSNQLKSYVSEEAAAADQAEAQFAGLFPKLSVQANYQYFAAIPDITIGPMTLPFGTNNTYSVGPNLSYALWDGFASRRSYDAAHLLADARTEDRKGARLQLLAQVRSAYVQVQLGIQELSLIYDTLQLSRAQKRDVATRYSAGSATTLDVVTADKSVGTYEIQLRQSQADLASSLQELLTLIGPHESRNFSRPGPEGLENITVALKFDSLDQLIDHDAGYAVAAPNDSHPQIRSLELQSQSAERAAASQTARLFPQLQVSAGASYLLPNIPNPSPYWQETVGATLSIPLYLGDPTPKLASEQRNMARAAQFQRDQTRDNIQRDFEKARNMLASLLEQKKLAVSDTALADRAAKLYYFSYRNGKVNLIDVQNANVQALQSKVDAARIDARILNQIILLKSLSGKEDPRG